MDALFVKSGVTLSEFAASFSRWFAMPPLEKRYSDHVPGGEYFCCYVPGLKVIICEDDDDVCSDERFMIYVNDALEGDVAKALLKCVMKRLQDEGVACKWQQVT